MTSSVAFAGNLNFLNLGELLQLLGTSGGSGSLRIISKYAKDPGVVYVEKGNPINATIGDLNGLDAIYSFFGWIEGQFNLYRKMSPAKKPSPKAGWKSFWMV